MFTFETHTELGVECVQVDPLLKFTLLFCQPSLFGLLRAILGRRFVLAELYDMMLVVGDMVLQANAEGCAPTC